MKLTSVLTTSLLLTCAALAAEAPKPSTEASAAFDRIRQLAGKWQTSSKNGTGWLTYEVVSGGNAVLERETMANMPPMLTVYYLDGDRLLLTHYCMAGNEPRMQARHFNADTGDLKFEFLDATNLTSPAAGHMHDVAMRLIDNDHFSSAWEFYENGKPKFTETAEYTRVH